MSNQTTTAPRQNQELVEYREVVGHIGYRVGSDGSIWSKRKRGTGPGPRFLHDWFRMKTAANADGYPCVGLYRDKKRKTYRLHLLILEAFVGPKPDGMIGLHNNGKPDDCRIENLRWGTCLENEADKVRHGTNMIGERHHAAKITDADVVAMRIAYQLGATLAEVGSRFGVHLSNVSLIVRRKTWGHVA